MKISKYVTIREQWDGYYNVCNNGKAIAKDLSLFGKDGANEIAEHLAKVEGKKTKLILR